MEEAECQGLCNLKTTADALVRFLDEKNVELFTRRKNLTKAEMQSRYESTVELLQDPAH